MKLKLYDTLTKELREFTPIEEGKVRMYQCGPTVYWTQHIGNMRAMVLGDLIRRTFEYFDYEVRYVRNLTDFGHLTSDSDTGDDKMDVRAKKENLSPEEVANKYIKQFNTDIALLNIKEATKDTRATEYIDEMIDMIKILLEKDYAYTTSEAIYFDISKAKEYTKLSGQRLDMLRQGAGFGKDTGSFKRNHSDFALWFFKTGSHANSLSTWESPFESELVENGEGTPGWHIECSAMSITELGDMLDIHMGGIEHVPVHHTNEIAQSEGYTGKKFASYWLHNEHLTVNKGKMSKSEGTAYAVKDVVEKGYKPVHLRYLFLQAQYRSKQDFTWDALEAAKVAYEGIVLKLKELNSSVDGIVLEEYVNKFKEEIRTDFNLPKGLAVVFKLLKASEQPQDIVSTILDMDRVLGLNLLDELNKSEEAPNEVLELKNMRKKAREDGNYEESDRLRDEMLKLGYMVKDTSDGQELIKI